MSAQLQLVTKVYETHKQQITADILAVAETILVENYKLESQEAYNMMFGDGCYDPFFAASPEYMAYQGEHGNEEDENIYLSNVWILALASANKPAYLPMIAKFADITVNGY